MYCIAFNPKITVINFYVLFSYREPTTRTRRRESAPLHFFTRRRPTTDDAYRESLSRFTRYRESTNGLPFGVHDFDAYHSISNIDAPSSSGEITTPTDRRTNTQYRPNTCPPKPNRSQSISGCRNGIAHHNGYRNKKISVQFHLGESTEDSDVSYDHRTTRHSMPVAMPTERGLRRGQTSIDSQTIREEEIEEFEGAHCMYSDSVNDNEQSSCQSPPTQFYKQNLNPFPSSSDASSLSTLCIEPQSQSQPKRGNCPAKPKRLLLNSKQSRKILTDAHFTGAYRNFEIQSPYYSDSSSMISSSVGKSNHQSIDSFNDDNALPFQVVLNKHGDEVEYALPRIDLPEYQKRHKLPNCLTSDDSMLAGEVFNVNPTDFDRILSENFEKSKSTISMHEEMHRNHHKNGHIMITDLDKSTDSTNTINDIDMNHKQQLHTDRIANFHQAIQQATDVICMISDFESVGKMEARIQTPLHFEWGHFKSTNVTVRKYADITNDGTNNDFILIAETAIIRDAEILRFFFHFKNLYQLI